MKVEVEMIEFHDLHTALHLSKDLIGNLTKITYMISSGRASIEVVVNMHTLCFDLMDQE